MVNLSNKRIVSTLFLSNYFLLNLKAYSVHSFLSKWASFLCVLLIHWQYFIDHFVAFEKQYATSKNTWPLSIECMFNGGRGHKILMAPIFTRTSHWGQPRESIKRCHSFSLMMINTMHEMSLYIRVQTHIIIWCDVGFSNGLLRMTYFFSVMFSMVIWSDSSINSKEDSNNH